MEKQLFRALAAATAFVVLSMVIFTALGPGAFLVCKVWIKPFNHHVNCWNTPL